MKKISFINQNLTYSFCIIGILFLIFSNNIFAQNTNYTICSGEHYTLTAPSGYSNYQWYNINGTDTIAITGSTTITLNISDIGKYIWKATDNNSCPIQLCNPVNIIAGNCNTPCPTTTYPICPNETYTLTAPIGLSNYSWHTISGTDTIAISGANSLIYIANAVGNYIWKATDANGCSIKLCCPVTLVAGNCNTPCPSTTYPICPNETYTLTAPTGLSNYSWHTISGTDTIAISGANSMIYIANAVGNYIWKANDANGCSIKLCCPVALVAGNCNTPCPSTTYPICPNETYTLTAPTGLSNYSWHTISGTDTIAISGANSMIYIANAVGNYIWKANDANGCSIKLCCPVALVAGNCNTPCPSTTYPICPNETYTLTAPTGLSNYSWHTISGTDTIAISGANSMIYIANAVGNYIWKANDANGCSIKLCCPVALVAGNCNTPCPTTTYPICPNETYTLTAPSGLSNYSWHTISGTDTIAISGANSMIYIANAVGNYIWKANDANGCSIKLCCPVALVAGNCNTPCPTTTYPICPNETYTLTAPSGLSNYSWYNISGTDTIAISGANSMIYIANAVGNYIWKANDANGCSIKLCCPVTLVAGNCNTPCPSTTYPICPNETYTLTAPTGLSNYSWYNISGTDTIAISGANSMIYIANAVGNYIWKANDANGCSIKLCCPVTLVAGNCNTPCPTTTYPICPNETYTLTAPTGLSNYSWYNISGSDTIAISGANSMIYIANAVGNYIWKANDANGCSIKLCCPVTLVAGNCNTPCPSTTYPICPNETYTLTAPTGLSNYSWHSISGTDTIAISGANSMIYIANAVGNYIWKANDANGCSIKLCCPVALVAGNCNTPCPTTTYPICPNETYTLTAPTGLSNYSWHTISGTDTIAISGANSMIYIANAVGNYIWKANDANGCSIKLCCPVTLVAGNCNTPCPTTTYPICPNETYTLTAPTGLSNYSWHTISGTDTIAISGANSMIYIANAVGNYIWKANDANGCSIKLCCPVALVAGNCNTPCPTTTYPICPNETYTLTAPTGLTNYSWYQIQGTDTVKINNANSNTYKAIAVGTYIWKGYESTGCQIKLCCPVKIIAGNCNPCNLTPPFVSVTNNVCPNRIGSINIDQNCGANSKIQYSLNNGLSWSDLKPLYSTTPLNITVRCVDLSDTSCKSTYSMISTTPQRCTPSVNKICTISANVNVDNCNNNNTDDNSIDDYFTFNVQAFVSNGGSNNKYEIVFGANNLTGLGGNVLNSGGTPYGNIIKIGQNKNFKADGTSSYNLIVRDIDNNSCFKTIELAPVASCSKSQNNNPINNACYPVPCVPIGVIKN